jgi:hypothetical protein
MEGAQRCGVQCRALDADHRRDAREKAIGRLDEATPWTPPAATPVEASGSLAKIGKLSLVYRVRSSLDSSRRNPLLYLRNF